MTTKYYVEFLFPGLLFSESENVQLKDHDPEEALSKMPQGAFAFVLYDVESRQGRLEDGEIITNEKTVNRSGRFYPEGVLVTLEEVKSMGERYSILASNMECNNWNPVVRTRVGNYQPIEKDDRVF